MARMTPDSRFQKLIDAASAVFIAQGYGRTQMAEIAEAMGVAKGTVYLYVESKEALFDVVLRYADAPRPSPFQTPCPFLRRLTGGRSRRSATVLPNLRARPFDRRLAAIGLGSPRKSSRRSSPRSTTRWRAIAWVSSSSIVARSTIRSSQSYGSPKAARYSSVSSPASSASSACARAVYALDLILILLLRPAWCSRRSCFGLSTATGIRRRSPSSRRPLRRQ